MLTSRRRRARCADAYVAKARKALGCKGFVAIKKGSALYNKARGFYGKGSPKK